MSTLWSTTETSARTRSRIAARASRAALAMVCLNVQANLKLSQETRKMPLWMQPISAIRWNTVETKEQIRTTLRHSTLQIGSPVSRMMMKKTHPQEKGSRNKSLIVLTRRIGTCATSPSLRISRTCWDREWRPNMVLTSQRESLSHSWSHLSKTRTTKISTLMWLVQSLPAKKAKLTPTDPAQIWNSKMMTMMRRIVKIDHMQIYSSLYRLQLYSSNLN